MFVLSVPNKDFEEEFSDKEQRINSLFKICFLVIDNLTNDDISNDNGTNDDISKVANNAEFEGNYSLELSKDYLRVPRNCHLLTINFEVLQEK